MQLEQKKGMPETAAPCIDDQIKMILSQVAEGFIDAAKGSPRDLQLPLDQIKARYPEFDGEAGMKLYKPVFWYLTGKDGPIACGNDKEGTVWHLKDSKATFDKGYFNSVAESVFNGDRPYFICNYHNVQKIDDIPRQKI
jgi:hypothetical protein